MRIRGFKKGVYGFTILFATLALVLSITTFCGFYSQRPTSFTSHPHLHDNAGYSGGGGVDNIHKITETIVGKIVEELKDLGEVASEPTSDRGKDRLRYTTFLAEIATLAASIDHGSGLQPLRGRECTKGTPHPLPSRGADEAIEQHFLVEEIRKYARIKPNRLGKQNFMGANGTFTSIGHACFSMKEELEEYMGYDVGDFCRDDWKLAQRLMVHGCDPLPRRRCFSRAPKLYSRPLPAGPALWSLPEDRNVRWSGYRCKSFACLARSSAAGKGFFKCADCFNLTHHERPRWTEAATNADFLIEEVLRIKPGEVRIGLDFSVGTGTFAARMKEFNVTVVSATINLGAPFSETIALRGLVPLYLTVNQRLPFFDNTLDMVHTTRFLDGWIDLVLLDFVLYDWDRVLRPGGLLWIDSFFCLEKDVGDYLEAFKMLRYKKHKWVVVPKVDKDGPEVFFSAVLEKPPRPF